jgi:hypothetical protein
MAEKDSGKSNARIVVCRGGEDFLRAPVAKPAAYDDLGRCPRIQFSGNVPTSNP